MAENCPSPFGGTFGENGGPGKIISPVAGSVGFHDSQQNRKNGKKKSVELRSRLLLLDHRTTCTVFPVFAMFAMTTMANSRTLTPVSQVTSINAG